MAVASRTVDLHTIPDNQREGAAEIARALHGIWVVNGQERVIEQISVADGSLHLLFAEGDEVLLPAKVLLNFPAIDRRLKERITSLNGKSNRIQQLADGCLAGVVLAYSAHKILRITTGLPGFIDVFLSATALGYPVSDSIYGYSRVEQLRSFEEIQDLEGQAIGRANVGESIFSFMAGVLFSASEVATICNVPFLAGVLSLSMLPFYTLAFGISTVVKSYHIFRSVKFKKELNQVMDHETSEAQKLQKGLEHIKELLTPSNAKIQEMLEELKQAGLTDTEMEGIIDEKFKEYESEKIKKLNELERQIGSKAMNELFEKLNLALADLEEGNLEKAQALLETIQKQTNKQILFAVLSIVISLVILAIFIVMTILTHGSTLALLV